MARWQPGAAERLRTAALELFAVQGYDGTTVAEIAAAAGVTERTFFRHFTDKREVIFPVQEEFERMFLERLDSTESGDPISIVAKALDGAVGLFPDRRRAAARIRHAVIAADPSLRERELLKLSSLAETLTRALAERGVDSTAAALAAESGVAVFRVAHQTWIAAGEERSYAEVQRSVLGRLRSLVTGDPVR